MTDRLVEVIVREDFGGKFAQVANIILKNPNVTLSELNSFCKDIRIRFNLLRHIIIILYEHNIIAIRSKILETGLTDQMSDKERIYYYSLSVPDVLHRISHPNILLLVKKKFGELCHTVIRKYIENGRLTALECTDSILESSERFEEREKIQKAIVSLINANYLQRIESPDSISNQLQEESQKMMESSKKRTKRKNKLSVSELDIMPGKISKKNEITTNVLSKSLAQNEKSKTKLDASLARSDSSTKKLKEILSDKERSLFIDAGTGEELIFSLNFRQYLHDYRAKMITELVSQKYHNQRAAAIMEMIMRESKLLSKAEKLKFTESMSGTEINENLNLHATIKDNETEKSLELLLKEKLLKKSVDVRDSSQIEYRVDMESIVKKLKGIVLGKIIENKFSNYHSRIFRVLEEKGYLTPKQVSDYCMIPLTDTRTYLFELFKARIVDNKEIQLQNDKDISYIFGTKIETVCESVIEDIRKTIHNLKARQKLEIQALESDVNLTEETKTKKRELIFKLETVILKLNNDVLLLADF